MRLKFFKALVSITAILLGTLSVPMIVSAATNEPSVIIQTIGNEGEMLSGVLMRIEDSSGSVVSFSKKTSGSYEVSKENNATDTISTKNGALEIYGLKEDETYNVFVKNPEGYEYPFQYKTFAVTSSATSSVILNFGKATGAITVKIIDEQSMPIRNSKFILTDGNKNLNFVNTGGIYVYSKEILQSEIITNEAGNAIMTGIPVGHYILQQINENGTYEDNGNIKITIIKDIPQEKTITNIVKKSNLKIESVDSNNIPKENTFQILSKEGKAINLVKTEDGVYSYFPQSPNAEITGDTFNGVLTINNLPVGQYVISPVTQPEGCEALSPLSVVVDNGTCHARFTVEYSTGTLVLKNEAEENAGAITFEIYDSTGTLMSYISKGNNKYQVNTSEATRITVEDNSEAYVYDIPSGLITIKQYYKDELIVEGSLYINTNQKTIYSNDGLKFLNNTFVFVGEDGTPVSNQEVMLVANGIPSTLKTDINGEINLSNLKDGGYTIYTKTVRPGYSNIKNISFEIADGEISIDKTIVIPFADVSIVVNNISSPIKFALVSDNYSETATTDKNGYCCFENLKGGEYKLRQLSEIKGFNSLVESIVYVNEYQDNEESLSFNLLPVLEAPEETVSNNSLPKIAVTAVAGLATAVASTVFFIIKNKKTSGRA